MDIVVPPDFQPLWKMTEQHPVVKYPAEVLRAVAEPVIEIDAGTRKLVEDMVVVMERANGVGLAAPQVGVLQRIIIIAPELTPIPLLNPTITHLEGHAVGEEGCLSLPGLYGDVERSTIAEVNALDMAGRNISLRLEGFAARIVQHEVDHLNGVLFIDKVDLSTLHWAWPQGVAAE
jgi:peptide deformylase